MNNIKKLYFSESGKRLVFELNNKITKGAENFYFHPRTAT